MTSGISKLGEPIRQKAAYLEVKEVKSDEGDSVQTHLHVRRKVAISKAAQSRLGSACRS